MVRVRTKIFELAGVDADLGATTSEAFGAPAKRPAYSVLRNQRLELWGLTICPSGSPAYASILPNVKRELESWAALRLDGEPRRSDTECILTPTKSVL
jgi:hypothetical protein